MIFIEGPRVISPFPSGLGVARPRSEPRLLLLSGALSERYLGILAAWSWLVRTMRLLSSGIGTAVGPAGAGSTCPHSVPLAHGSLGSVPGSSHSKV